MSQSYTMLKNSFVFCVVVCQFLQSRDQFNLVQNRRRPAAAKRLAPKRGHRKLVMMQKRGGLRAFSKLGPGKIPWHKFDK